jgi:hypothetical protein
LVQLIAGNARQELPDARSHSASSDNWGTARDKPVF